MLYTAIEIAGWFIAGAIIVRYVLPLAAYHISKAVAIGWLAGVYVFGNYISKGANNGVAKRASTGEKEEGQRKEEGGGAQEWL